LIRIGTQAAPVAPGRLFFWLDPWLAIAIAVAAVAVPWVLYPATTNGLLAALAPSELWAALWAVLVGGVLCIGLWQSGHLRPRIPEGDVLAAGARLLPATRQLGRAMEQIDGHLRQWPVAGVLFLALTTLLGVTMLAGG
jgi:hypothetical protein